MKSFIECATPVGIGEFAVSADPRDILAASGIGSCLILTLHDPAIRAGGLLHAALPLKNVLGPGPWPGKYVDSGFDAMLREMTRLGARKDRLVVQMAGGSSLLSVGGAANVLDTGRRNIAAAELVVAREGMRIAAADVGGSRGRTVRLHVESGTMTVQTLGGVEEVLSKTGSETILIAGTAA